MSKTETSYAGLVRRLFCVARRERGRWLGDAAWERREEDLVEDVLDLLVTP